MWQSEWEDRPEAERPVVNTHSDVQVNMVSRVSARNNYPGLKKFYATVLDEKGDPAPGIKIRFDTEPSFGIAWDHLSVWGYTNERGYLEWPNHLGVPTRYQLYWEDDEAPLIENIRTDLGNEYLIDPRTGEIISYVPVNRPGRYSFRIELQRKVQGV